MAHLIIFLCLLALVLPSFAMRPLLASTPEPVRAARFAVFSLFAGNDAICTSFAVEGPRRERYMMTAGHCAIAAVEAKAEIYAYDFETKAKYPLKLHDFKKDWPRADWAIYHYVSAYPQAGLKLTAEIPRLGDDVWTISAPLSYSPVLSGGIYAGVMHCTDNLLCEAQLGGMHWIQTPMTSGASGGPVFNKAGLVWGILAASDKRMPGMNTVVPVVIN